MQTAMELDQRIKAREMELQHRKDMQDMQLQHKKELLQVHGQLQRQRQGEEQNVLHHTDQEWCSSSLRRIGSCSVSWNV